jgi:DNA-binding MurR/RpiR family transcriptional regulator
VKIDEVGAVDSDLAGLRERIARSYPELSPQLRSIAEFSVANIDVMAVETAQNLAKRMDVPPSSLVRFAQALGYRGFNEMKHDFREHLMYRLGEAREREAIREQTATGAIAVLDALLSDSRRDLDRFAKELDRKQFDRAVLELAAAEDLAIVAQHASYALAVLFQQTLLALGRSCDLLDDRAGLLLQQVEFLRRDTVLLALSFPPYQPTVVRAAKLHRDLGRSVVGITDTLLSPLAKAGQITLEVPQRTPTTAQPVAGAACLLQALAIAIGEQRKLSGGGR